MFKWIPSSICFLVDPLRDLNCQKCRLSLTRHQIKVQQLCWNVSLWKTFLQLCGAQWDLPPSHVVTRFSRLVTPLINPWRFYEDVISTICLCSKDFVYWWTFSELINMFKTCWWSQMNPANTERYCGKENFGQNPHFILPFHHLCFSNIMEAINDVPAVSLKPAGSSLQIWTEHPESLSHILLHKCAEGSGAQTSDSQLHFPLVRLTHYCPAAAHTFHPPQRASDQTASIFFCCVFSFTLSSTP